MTLRATSAFATVLAVAAFLAAPTSAGDFVGMYADDAFFGSPAYRSLAFGAQSEAGVEIVRQPFDWRRIETSPGQYVFSDYDDFVLRAAGAGLRVLPVLGNPPWFRAESFTSDSSWSPPLSNAAFGAFAAQLVKRYGPQGTLWAEHPDVVPLPVHSWQIWNEPNLSQFWNTGPDAARYTALLKAAHAAIHAADPGAEVVAAGLPNSSFGIALDRYLGDMLGAGAPGAFDAAAVNAYAPAPADSVGLVSLTRSVLTAHGDYSPVWVTEVGWPTGGRAGSFIGSEGVQAAYIGDVIRRLGAARTVLGVRGVIIFRWHDAVAAIDAWPLHAGLLRSDGSPKPALAAFRDAVASIAPAPLVADGTAAAAPTGGAMPGAPSTASDPARARVAITGGGLSRFGFLRIRISCLDSACFGRLRAGRPGQACGGSRKFTLGRGRAVVRVLLRRARHGRTHCGRLLVTADTGPGDVPAAAILPEQAGTVTFRQ